MTPGLIKTEMTDGKFISKKTRLQLDHKMHDKGPAAGTNYLTVPHWYEGTKLGRFFALASWIGGLASY
ncbi:hypothetical protein J1N35_016333 [Gossypium stocksii]|uniref:Uncharacterized protein n=1 Tax=Gossypium stocksii TaxID=47602 RepID=A0A9D3VK04_9ROSI|nr:hypothetical protein J1N35_016333 [Gossypium stocksii]